MKSAAIGEDFVLAQDDERLVDHILLRYPPRRQASAVMPLLDLVQRRSGGWLPDAAIEYVAKRLNMAPLRVREIVSFYSMFNLKPIGRHFVQICRTTPCWLRGSEAICKALKDRLHIAMGETTEEGLFTLIEVECLGACANAPVMQIGDDYYEDLEPGSAVKIIDDLSQGRVPKPGSQIGRQGSMPFTSEIDHNRG